MSRFTSFIAIGVAFCVAVAARGASVQTPRILPLPEAQWTPEIRAVLTSLGQSGPATNDVKTLARHPELLKSVMPFAAYIANGSELPPRDRELLILRTAWLCHADYVWAQHAPIAERYGIGRPERRRIAKGPIGWDAFDRTLIHAADELHDSSFITDQTWNALAARYDRRQMLDALFTISGVTMLAGAMNTFGVQPDEHLTERLPTDVTRQRTITPLEESDIRLPRPRIPRLTAAELTPEARGILDPSNSGRLGGTAATYGHHVKLYQPRQILSDYLRFNSSFARAHPMTHETLILRTALLNRSQIEWAAHQKFGRDKGMTTEHIQRILGGPDAPVWDRVDAALLRAADEMQYDVMIGRPIWDTLATRYDTQQLMDIAFTTAGYRLITTGQNALGLQSDQPPGIPPIWPKARP